MKMSMQVTYQSSSIGTTVFTANTKVESNVFIGNSTVFASAEYAEWPPEELPYVQQGVKAVDRGDGVIDYYDDTVVYYTDYGHSLWAAETLTGTELDTFFAQVAVWASSVSTVKSNPDFNYWWSRYTSDPKVTVSNT
jgi:hypothetical protein